MRAVTLVVLAIATACGSASPAARSGATLPDVPSGRSTQTLALPGGELVVTFVVPAGVSPADHPRVLLALPPGGQTQDLVDTLLDRYWADEASRRGIVVASPAAPAGGLLYDGAAAGLVRELADALIARFMPPERRLLIGGVSNGGLSAFRLALDRPEVVAGLVVAPGMPPTDDDYGKLSALAAVPVGLFVGEDDAGWREGSERVARTLADAGDERVTLTVSPGEGHILEHITAPTLWDAFALPS